MNVFHAGAVLLLALGGALAQAADRGIYTVVEGDARVLRATTRYRLEPGTRAENGDVIDASEGEFWHHSGDRAFVTEARAAGRLHHPNIIAIYEYGEDDSIAYIAMEYVDGIGLREYLNRRARFELHPLEQAFIDLTTSRLAVYLGPIAKVVARNAARQARDSDEFVQLVAEPIGTQERNAFLNELSGE